MARTAPAALDVILRRAGLSEDEVARFHREIVEYGALPGALGWYRALPFSVGATPGPIRVPTTHVWSDGDTALARRGAELTASQVEAAYELRILRGVGHWVPTQAPEALAEIILARITSPIRRPAGRRR